MIKKDKEIKDFGKDGIKIKKFTGKKTSVCEDCANIRKIQGSNRGCFISVKQHPIDGHEVIDLCINIRVQNEDLNIFNDCGNWSPRIGDIKTWP